MLSSSRMIKESRGNVAEAVAMGQRVVETLGTTSMVDTSLVTDAGVLEIVPSLQWFHEITKELGNKENLTFLFGTTVEEDKSPVSLGFKIGFARKKLSKITIGQENAETNNALAGILTLVGAESKLNYRRKIFAQSITSHVMDLYWQEKSINKEQLRALETVLDALEVLYT